MGYVGNQTTTAYTSMTKQDITGDGTSNYTLSHAVANANEIEVYINNVRQEPTTAYSASGTALTMTGTVASSDNFYVVFQGKAVGTVTPPDGSVGTAKIADGSVTSTKLDTNIAVTGTLTANGGAVFNEASADVDFRVESNGQANMLFVDGGNDTVSFQPNSASLTIKAGSGDATNNIRLEAGGTTSTYLEYRGYLGHQFYVDTTELIRINSNGTTAFGSTANDARINISADGNSMTPFIINSTASGTGASNIARFRRNGTNVGEIEITGSSTSYVTSSDYRLKENVVTDWDATTRLKQLKPSRFNFIIDADITVDGFLAHEVQAIVPEAITGTKDAMDADGNPEYQGIDQSKLVPLLVKTIQELEARITALEGA